MKSVYPPMAMNANIVASKDNPPIGEESDALAALERMRDRGSLLPLRLQSMHRYKDYEIIKKALFHYHELIKGIHDADSALTGLNPSIEENPYNPEKETIHYTGYEKYLDGIRVGIDMAKKRIKGLLK